MLSARHHRYMPPLIAHGRKTPDGSTLVPTSGARSIDPAALWVLTNRGLVDRAFAVWLEAGDWPTVERLQRDLDRGGDPAEVEAAYRAMPTYMGEVYPRTVGTVVLPLYVLRFVPDAAPLLSVCWQILRRGIELYFSDDDAPELRSTDPLLRQRVDTNVDMLGRAAALLMSDYPSPFGGGTLGGEDWTRQINGQTARQFRDVTTLDEYLARQAEIVDSARRPPEASRATPRQPYVFVLMPFNEDWSAGVYDLIKRAVDTLRPDLDILVERADEISKPGKITDQIIQAIRNADVVVADITGNNPNVMWELGFAQALDKLPVILNQAIAEVPFDLHDWRQVIYSVTPVESDEFKIAMHIREALVPAARQVLPF